MNAYEKNQMTNQFSKTEQASLLEPLCNFLLHIWNNLVKKSPN